MSKKKKKGHYNPSRKYFFYFTGNINLNIKTKEKEFLLIVSYFLFDKQWKGEFDVIKQFISPDFLRVSKKI